MVNHNPKNKLKPVPIQQGKKSEEILKRKI